METDIINIKKTSGNLANTTGTLRKTSEEIKGQIWELEKAQQAMEDSITDLQSRSIREIFCSLGWPNTKERERKTVFL